MKQKIRFLIAALCLLAFGYVSGRNRLWLGLLVILCRLLGLRRLPWLMPFTLISCFTLGPMPGFVTNHWPAWETVAAAKFDENLMAHPSLQFLSLLLRIALWLGLCRLVWMRSRGSKLLLLHAALLLLLVGLGWATTQLPTVPATMAYSLSLGFSATFFFLCYLVLEKPRPTVPEVVTLGVVPFFEASVIPRPVLDISPQPDFASLDQRCLKLTLGMVALVLFGDTLNRVMLGLPVLGYSVDLPGGPLPGLGDSGLSSNLFLVYSRTKLVLAIVWSSFYRITNHFSLFAFIEACYLLLGYDVPARFRLPLRANSFGEFYNAIMPYYVMMVNRIYLYPIFSWLRTLGWSKRRAYDVALALGLFFGGAVTHILRDVHLVPLMGSLAYLQRSLATDFLYLSVLFVAIRLLTLPPTLQRLPGPCKFLLWLLVYSFVLLCRMGGLFTDLRERLAFMARLFFGA
ncbi:hypothetical protein IV102_02575 [bacterium]|nr:hypothetical protein [bacterium]